MSHLFGSYCGVKHEVMPIGAGNQRLLEHGSNSTTVVQLTERFRDGEGAKYPTPGIPRAIGRKAAERLCEAASC